MSALALLSGTQVISLVGYQGSGKSFLGSKLARLLRTDKVEVSDIVKGLHKGLTRSQLPSTGEKTAENPDWLGKEVAKSVQTTTLAQVRSVVVLTGVREIEVHRCLQKYGAHLWVVEITADAPIRYKRLLSLDKIKTTEDFLNQELRERVLGTQEVIDEASYVVQTTEESDPTKIAKAIVARLAQKGAKF